MVKISWQTILERATVYEVLGFKILGLTKYLRIHILYLTFFSRFILVDQLYDVYITTQPMCDAIVQISSLSGYQITQKIKLDYRCMVYSAFLALLDHTVESRL